MVQQLVMCRITTLFNINGIVVMFAVILLTLGEGTASESYLNYFTKIPLKLIIICKLLT
jgi:hypothetical protein